MHPGLDQELDVVGEGARVDVAALVERRQQGGEDGGGVEYHVDERYALRSSL